MGWRADSVADFLQVNFPTMSRGDAIDLALLAGNAIDAATAFGGVASVAGFDPSQAPLLPGRSGGGYQTVARVDYRDPTTGRRHHEIVTSSWDHVPSEGEIVGQGEAVIHERAVQYGWDQSQVNWSTVVTEFYRLS